MTAPERTLLDLGSVVSIPRVEFALEDALRRRLTSVPRLATYAAEQCVRGRRGCKALRTVLRDRPLDLAPTESHLETRCWRFFKRHGLPLPTRQLEVPDAGVDARFDFAYEAQLLAIEADGYRFHSGRKVWRHDRQRMSALAASGWRIIFITKEDLDARPERKADQISRALRPYAPASAQDGSGVGAGAD